MIATKPITGSWFEFLHHNTPEGKYWNEALTAFTEEQWRLKLREMKGAGLKYVVLMATALYSKAYFKTDIFPEWKIGCANPIEVLLDEADRLDLRVFIGTGFYGDWTDADGNMKDPAVLSRMLRAINELAALYGHHKSFYGWYYPDEAWINGHMSEEFMRYVNLSSAEVHRMGAHFKTLIGPYGTRDVIADDRYIRDLEGLDVDFAAYQDEIGVEKTRVEESAGFYEALKRVHDKAGRSRLWADVEAFRFEGEVYHSALLPAPFERLRKQLEAVSPYVDEILIYEYPGLFNRPGTGAFAGHPSSEKLYTDYMAYRAEQEKKNS